MEAQTQTIQVNALEGLKVHYISLVPSPANKRHFLIKAAQETGCEVIEKEIRIVKADARRRVVYGVVLAPDEVDDERDTITTGEIEKAAYAFMLAGRTQQIDTDHSFEAGAGFVAESWLVRQGDPLFAEEPEGTWAVGIKVTDDEVWARIEKDELTGLSVAGLARRQPVEVELEAEEEGMTDIEKQQAEPSAAAEEDVAKNFADRVIAHIKEAFSGGAVEVVKASGQEEKKNVKTEPDAGLPDEVEPVEKATPGQDDQVVLARIEKGFKEKLLRSQLWTISDALTGAIREVLEDDDITDKVAAVGQVVDEFQTWLEAQVGDAVAKGAGEPGSRRDEAGEISKAVKEALLPIEQKLEALDKHQQQARVRLEAIEKQTPPRQTVLGGEDGGEVEKSMNGKKGYRGLPLKI